MSWNKKTWILIPCFLHQAGFGLIPSPSEPQFPPLCDGEVAPTYSSQKSLGVPVMYQALFKVHKALLEFIELAIKFVRVFLYHLMEKNQMNFLANPVHPRGGDRSATSRQVNKQISDTDGNSAEPAHRKE